MSILDQNERSADALAFADTDLLVLSRRRFDAVPAHPKRLTIQRSAGACARSKIFSRQSRGRRRNE